MRNLKKILLIVVIGVFQYQIYGQGYEIKIKIIGLQDTMVLLGHHFKDAHTLYPDDTVIVNKKGEGVFSGKEPFSGGMYFIYLPNGKYFDILLNENQKFEIIADTSTKTENIKVKGSIENELFNDYRVFMINKQDEAAALRKKKENAPTEGEKEEIEKQIDSIRVAFENKMEYIITNYSNTFFARFLKGTQDVKIPDPPKDEKGNIIDSAFQYYYYKNHYFDNFDFTDPRMLRTPLYEEKINTFTDRVIPQIPDSLIKACDMLIEGTRASEELFRYMLVSLFNKYAKSEIMGMDAVYIHIADKYYIKEAHWSDTAFINDLKERVIKVKPLLLGKVAPNSRLVNVPSELFVMAKEDTALKKNPYVGQFFNIHDVEAKYLAIIFWSVDCGHCKKSLPKLYEIYEKYKDIGFNVLAVHMLIDKEKWTDYINENEFYSWINAWNPYSHQYKEDYDARSTNIIYLLDKDKKIIAKHIGAEQVEDIIKHREGIKE